MKRRNRAILDRDELVDVIQLRIIDGKVDLDDLSRKVEEYEDGSKVYLTPLPMKFRSFEKVEKIFTKIFEATEKVYAIGFCKINGKINQVEYDRMYGVSVEDEWDDDLSNKWQVFEFGRTLRERWVFRPSMKETFLFLNSYIPNNAPFFYLASEAIIKGVVIPGGSFYFDEKGAISKGFMSSEPKSLLQLLKLIFEFYADANEGKKALVAVSDGQKSRLLLELTLETFEEVKAISFWQGPGKTLCDEFEIECEIADLPGRDASILQAYMLLEASRQNAVPIWGADHDFLSRHSIPLPEIFTPFWFLYREDLQELFDETSVAFDDILNQPV